MIALDITQAEIERVQMTTEHLDTAIQALRNDGFVVLNDVVDRAHLELLRARMLQDLERILARTDVPFNFNTGNVQQDPPPFPPYLFRDVLLNDMVIAVTRALLGPGVRNSFYSGNTALPGGQRQPVHPDVGQLWPGLEHPTPAFGVVVNIPTVDMDVHNGSTELWPGTHLDTTYTIHDGAPRVPQEMVEQWRATYPPIQPSVRCGSVLLRDIRLWHAGMPNHSQAPRPMIAMIHTCSWWEMSPLTFPQGTETFFEHPILTTNARFVGDSIDHTLRHTSHDLRS